MSSKFAEKMSGKGAPFPHVCGEGGLAFMEPLCTFPAPAERTCGTLGCQGDYAPSTIDGDSGCTCWNRAMLLDALSRRACGGSTSADIVATLTGAMLRGAETQSSTPVASSPTIETTDDMEGCLLPRMREQVSPSSRAAVPTLAAEGWAQDAASVRTLALHSLHCLAREKTRRSGSPDASPLPCDAQHAMMLAAGSDETPPDTIHCDETVDSSNALDASTDSKRPPTPKTVDVPEPAQAILPCAPADCSPRKRKLDE